jgi:ubiquinone/menaquinone biosynthesis C-methylase UbiE
MSSPSTDRVFAGSVPQLYQQHMVPLIFEPYAADLASRVALHQPTRVLEIAAGTGVVTRHLARVLPKQTSIMATDLNQPMLDQVALSPGGKLTPCSCHFRMGLLTWSSANSA